MDTPTRQEMNQITSDVFRRLGSVESSLQEIQRELSSTRAEFARSEGRNEEFRKTIENSVGRIEINFDARERRMNQWFMGLLSAGVVSILGMILNLIAAK